MKLTIAEVDVDGPAGAHPGSCLAHGGVHVGPLLQGGDLRLVVATLDAGASLQWPVPHGEEALYVLAGALDLDGEAVPSGGAVVLHAGGAFRVDATEPSRVAHFWTAAPTGSAAPPAPADQARAHVLGPDGWARSGSRAASWATWFADSTCDGCDVTFMKVERDTPGNRGRAHTHSADELILVVEGSISFGAHALPAGTAVHVPAETRYAVTCGPTRHAFLNYRAGPSTQLYEGDTEPVLETALGRGGSLVRP